LPTGLRGIGLTFGALIFREPGFAARQRLMPRRLTLPMMAEREQPNEVGDVSRRLLLVGP
jgi:hypothetical protein